MDSYLCFYAQSIVIVQIIHSFWKTHHVFPRKRVKGIKPLSIITKLILPDPTWRSTDLNASFAFDAKPVQPMLKVARKP